MKQPRRLPFTNASNMHHQATKQGPNSSLVVLGHFGKGLRTVQEVRGMNPIFWLQLFKYLWWTHPENVSCVSGVDRGTFVALESCLRRTCWSSFTWHFVVSKDRQKSWVRWSPLGTNTYPFRHHSLASTRSHQLGITRNQMPYDLTW